MCESGVHKNRQSGEPEQRSGSGGFGLRITWVRVIAQVVFFGLFCFFVVVNSFGMEWFEKRGWPVNLFFNLDPLIAFCSSLSSGQLFGPLAWSLVTVVGTLVLGRVFCSWVCPYGALHHFVGWAFGPRSAKARIAANRYRSMQRVKYWILAFMVVVAAGNLPLNWVRQSRGSAWAIGAVVVGLVVVVSGVLLFRRRRRDQGGRGRGGWWLMLIVPAVYVLGLGLLSVDTERVSSLQIGLLDPFCLLHRSITTAVLPLIDWPMEKLYSTEPLYGGSFLIGVILLVLVGLNVLIPRFFCRVLCPLGAMLGLLSRFAFWRIERSESRCTSCQVCVKNCEGACEPDKRLRLSECVVCFNCVDSCGEGALSFAGPLRGGSGAEATEQGGGALVGAAVSRREVILSGLSGVLALPLARLSGASSRGWHARVIRPPGSLPEEQFLQTCLKCGQCMRVCPTNVLQGAGLEAGVEGLWTPVLNNKIGRGCMPNCTACGGVCPTAAIRPITIERKRGLGRYAEAGPIRLGTAFVDRGRCLPWAMDQPCSVCEEVCPVSPKAIFLRSAEEVLRLGVMAVSSATASTLTSAAQQWQDNVYATGDHICEIVGGAGTGQRRMIKSNGSDTLSIGAEEVFEPALDDTSRFVIKVQVSRPHVAPELCIGCGICEHECPVSGLRAIRVTAENETRSKERSLLLRR